MKHRIPAVLAAVLALALIGGIALATHPRSTTADVVVWQSTADPSRLYLSTRAAAGEWRTADAPLDMEPSRSPRFRRSGIVTIEVPLPDPPAAPEASPPGVDGPPPIAGSIVGTVAFALLASPDGADMGAVEIVQGPQGLVISAHVTGLSPGGHGFHIHETGVCAPDFAAAGDHFNPTDASHGALFGPSRHAGDLPNLYAATDGKARADVFTTAMTLAIGQPHSLLDADGSAVIIHEKPDTYGEDAGAGGRVACGVIQLADDSVEPTGG